MSEGSGPATPRPLAFLSGNWVEASAMQISVEDVGFRQAATAVERLRTYGGRLFAFDEHWARWVGTLSALRLDGLPDRDATRAVIAELFRRNAPWVTSEGDVGLTLFATPGSAAGGSPTFGAHLNRLDFERIDRRRQKGQPLAVTDVVQPDPASWPRGIKVRCRLHYYLADLAARDVSPDAAGLLRDSDGTVTETSIANVALVRGGTIVSPPADRILGGVTQAIVERLAAEESIRWEREPIGAERLAGADEVLLMGTDPGIWFAPTVDGQPIGDGGPGSIYLRLRDRFDRLTGSGSPTATDGAGIADR